VKQNLALTLTSKLSDEVTEVTFIRDGSQAGTLDSMLSRYDAISEYTTCKICRDEALRISLMYSMPPADGTLSRVKVFSAMDGSMALNIFTFGKQVCTWDSTLVCGHVIPCFYRLMHKRP
jgi:hypothetical protein